MSVMVKKFALDEGFKAAGGLELYGADILRVERDGLVYSEIAWFSSFTGSLQFKRMLGPQQFRIQFEQAGNPGGEMIKIVYRV